MKLTKNLKRINKLTQTGVVLFFALIALVIMSLAAVALIRSVDTSTLIAGNLSFKQAATTSADTGIEASIAQVIAMRDSAANSAHEVTTDALNTLNKTDLANNPGYYSNADPALILLDNTTWSTANNAVNVTWDSTGATSNTDSSGNTIQYIVQRMCRDANTAIRDTDCLFSAATEDGNGQNVPLPKDICDGPGCPSAAQSPQIRVTVRVAGPKNTVSYVQAFVY
jgi:type IV pilus assembly protein PilX